MKNKKKAIRGIVALGVIIMVGAICLGTGWFGNYPFRKLSAEQVERIEVTEYQNNETKIVDKRDDIQEIVKKLQAMPVYNKENASDYCGGMLDFLLCMKDGTTRLASVGSPLFYADGQWYRTKHKPAAELNEMYRKLDYPIHANSTNPTDLPDIHRLPDPYPVDVARKNGDYINMHGKEENTALLTEFLEAVEAGELAFVRITQYTIEGDAVITDVQYKDGSFLVVVDSTRDKYAAEEDRGFFYTSYKHLIKQQDEYGKVCIYLYNSGQFSEELLGAEGQEVFLMAYMNGTLPDSMDTEAKNIP